MKRHLCKPQLTAALSLIALASAFSPLATAEDTLGRLFFTPERRQELDRQRQFNIQERQEIPEDPTLTINGVVMRSSGKKTVWVNGVTVGDNDSASNIEVVPVHQNPGRVVIHAAEMPPAAAKVGNTVHLDTGENTDLLRGGRVIVRQLKSVP